MSNDLMRALEFVKNAEVFEKRLKELAASEAKLREASSIADTVDKAKALEQKAANKIKELEGMEKKFLASFKEKEEELKDKYVKKQQELEDKYVKLRASLGSLQDERRSVEDAKASFKKLKEEAEKEMSTASEKKAEAQSLEALVANKIARIRAIMEE